MFYRISISIWPGSAAADRKTDSSERNLQSRSAAREQRSYLGLCINHSKTNAAQMIAACSPDAAAVLVHPR